MSANKSNWRLACVLAGVVLSAVCGSSVVIGLIVSGIPNHSFAQFLKFVCHPITLLFFVGLGLAARGLYAAK